jgi:thiol-disulfide isomerase/thioredoxin
VRQGALFAAVALAAAAAGGALWWVARPAPQGTAARIEVSQGALLSAAFTDLEGGRHSLAEFAGKTVVLNFWATWCAPCREEMPAFSRLQARWGAKGVQFVGLSAEEPATVARFARDLRIGYPLWVGEASSELSRRLGNRTGGLPHTVILDPAGKALDVKVGPYTEAELDGKLRQFLPNF